MPERSCDLRWGLHYLSNATVARLRKSSFRKRLNFFRRFNLGRFHPEKLRIIFGFRSVCLGLLTFQNLPTLIMMSASQFEYGREMLMSFVKGSRLEYSKIKVDWRDCRLIGICCIPFLLMVLMSGASWGQQDEDSVLLRVDFRDGSTLEASFPDTNLVWRNIAKDGTVGEKKVRIRDVKKISLVQEPSTSRVSKIRKLLSQLGSEDYHDRINAQLELAKTGKEFEEIISRYQPEDEETKWRIEKVKEILAEETGPAVGESTFDVLEIKGGEKPLDGELSELTFPVQYGNRLLKIGRSNVATISIEPLQTNFSVENSSGGGKRVQDYPDENGALPAGMHFEGFEMTPEGKKISANMDVSRAFVGKGLLLETSFKDSYVGALKYTFSGGRGGDFSIANVEPTYQGTITIKFCVPGSPLFAAGTRYIGFNVSHVNPEGTYFEAYNAQGQMMTRFSTDQLGTDYLGFQSEVPIAKVVVRPNPDIDEDFAIDDLFFEKPFALLESGNPEFFSIVTRKGERLQAETIDVDGQSLILKGLSFGADQLEIDIEDVWVAIPPGKNSAERKTDASPVTGFCLFMDGSISLVDFSLKKKVRLGSDLDLSQVVALWGLDQQLTAPPSVPVSKGSALLYGNDQFYDLANVGLGVDWLNSPSIDSLSKLALEGDPDASAQGIDLKGVVYSNSPCVYLRRPKEIGPSSGVVYTVGSERYFFGQETGASIKINQSGIRLVRGELAVDLNWSEIRSLRFPGK